MRSELATGRKRLVWLVALLLWVHAASSASEDARIPGLPVTGPPICGIVRLVDSFSWPALGNPHSLVIYLPPGYAQAGNTERYPVLYLQDGQNVFDSRTSSFGHEWRLDETAESLIGQGKMAPLIMVGVYNTEQRMAEYTQVSDPHHPGGRADDYDTFLIEGLKPWIDSHFRTLPDAHHTGIMGSSLGGLLALYTGWKHPDVFGLVAALSPSLWWADQQLTRSMADDRSTRRPDRIWLDIGTHEGDEPLENVENTRRLHEELLAEGYVDDMTVFYREIPAGSHNEISWAARGGDVLVHLFPP